METKIYQVAAIEQAADLIKAGELVAFPTETVYGLGADATNEEAVKKVYEAKGRPSDNPLIIHIADTKTLEKYVVEIPEAAKELMAHFWPGSLTLIFKIKPNSFSKVVTGGLDTAAFRMPDSEATLKFIKASGVPLVGPSANTSGKPSPTAAEHVYHDLQGKIAGILNDGITAVGLESTVLDMSEADEVPMILRPGAVTRDEIEAVIGEVAVDQHILSEDEQPKAPGMKYKHYAPNAQVIMIDGDTADWDQAVQWVNDNGKVYGLLANESILKRYQVADERKKFSLGHEANVKEAAKRLFDGLRYFDDQADVAIILAETFPPKDLGAAYMNRLEKAANRCYFSQLI